MKKRFLFTSLFLIFTVIFCTLSPVITKSESINEKVFRLHILANSNSADDQALKLKVRDRVMEVSKDIFKDCRSVEEASAAAERYKNELNQTVQSVIREYGYTYPSVVYTAKEFFDIREYDTFTLPAGIYDCLKIDIGEGQGKNWWCVLFPSVCLSGCTEDLEETLSPDEMEMVQNEKYIVRFKAAEIYERIKYKLKKEG